MQEMSNPISFFFFFKYKISSVCHLLTLLRACYIMRHIVDYLFIRVSSWYT